MNKYLTLQNFSDFFILLLLFELHFLFSVLWHTLYTMWRRDIYFFHLLCIHHHICVENCYHNKKKWMKFVFCILMYSSHVYIVYLVHDVWRWESQSFSNKCLYNFHWFTKQSHYRSWEIWNMISISITPDIMALPNLTTETKKYLVCISLPKNFVYIYA